MEALDTVREFIGDRPQSLIENATGDGTTTIFPLGAPESFLDDTLKVLVDGAIVSDYIVDYGAIIFTSSPADGAKIQIMYKEAILTDAFITGRLEETGEVPILAAIACLLAMASNKALLARTITISSYTKNETQVAKELRDQASALRHQYEQSAAANGEDYITPYPFSGFGDRGV